MTELVNQNRIVVRISLLHIIMFKPNLHVFPNISMCCAEWLDCSPPCCVKKCRMCQGTALSRGHSGEKDRCKSLSYQVNEPQGKLTEF